MLSILVSAALTGAPFVQRADKPFVVELVSFPNHDELTWHAPGGTIYTWVTKPGERASAALASACIKQKLCEAGRCPLLPVAVVLVPKKITD